MLLKESIQTVSMIGAGNVGWHLAHALFSKGFRINEVCSRNPESAAELAEMVEATPVSSVSELKNLSDLYIIAVTDSAIPAIVRELNVGDRIVAHTAGSVNMNELATASSKTGILYPLQTLSKKIDLDFSQVPLCIEASGKSTLRQLEELANKLSSSVVHVNSEDRMLLHVAAVFSSNFSNHMFAKASQLLEKRDLSFEILEPLIRETTRKALAMDPGLAQTGPARRKDTAILEKHLQLLAGIPEYEELYRILSNSIMKQYE